MHNRLFIHYLNVIKNTSSASAHRHLFLPAAVRGEGAYFREAEKAVDHIRIFDNNRNISYGASMAAKVKIEDVIRYADMFSAMGSEPRLRIMRLLLSAHPEGMVVGDIAAELGVAASTLSHHLEKLKNEDLVRVQREGTFLRYTANTGVLEELLGFLFAECCTRNKAIAPQKIVFCK